MTITAEDRAALLDHDRRFFDALVGGDVQALERLLADDFVLVGIEDGAIARRDALLGLISGGSLRFPAIESFPEEAIVRRIGDTGIVVGRTTMNFTGPDGAPFTAASRYTHVFALTPDGTWRLHSAQGTTIRP
ncbi:YybH family protein [Nonomuraea sediminis]|uniref:YybH family protein n=1 Tax=Nonomuraea sediminis TaxID=2835864 RepID=UPI001BDCD825|nr:nuclear transport factor 2 family protein [Nonomuraea sediminis]